MLAGRVIIYIEVLFGGLTQLVRVPSSQGGSRRFESRIPHHYYKRTELSKDCSIFLDVFVTQFGI